MDNEGLGALGNDSEACETSKATGGPADQTSIENPEDGESLNPNHRLNGPELFVLVAQWVSPLDREDLENFPCVWASK